MPDTDSTIAATPTGKRMRQQIAATADTTLADAPCDETTVLPPQGSFVPTELAWSQHPDADDWAYPAADEPPRNDRKPLPSALLALLVFNVVAVVGLVIGLGVWHSVQTAPRPSLGGAAPGAADGLEIVPEQPAAQTRQAPVPPAAPAPVSHDPADKYTAPAVQTTPDQDFDWLIRSGSTTVPISNDVGHVQGRQLCVWLAAAPRSGEDTYEHLQGVFPDMTAAQLGSFAGAAKEAYCPQYRLPG